MELANALSYRTKNISDSDSDSDNSDSAWKRSIKSVQDCEKSDHVSSVPPPTPEKSDTGLPKSRKRKANSIWSSVLEDQMMSEDLKEIGLKRKPLGYGERSSESYDFTLKYSDPRNIQDSEPFNEFSDDQMDSSELPAKRSKLGCRKFPNLSKEEIPVADKIAKTLNEKKKYLIYRVVKAVGTDKALEILKMTEQVEENGGMMIKNNSRRRTPGGVYLQLLKADSSVTKEQVDEIFEGEFPTFMIRNMQDARKKKRKKFSKPPKNSAFDMPMKGVATIPTQMEPSVVTTVPSPAEKQTVDDDVDLEEGEIDD